MIFITLLTLVAALVYFFLRWLKEKNAYWERRNIKHIKPNLLFGNNYQSFIGRKNRAEVLAANYFAFPSEEIIGHYDYLIPRLIIRRAELIEKVLIKDFSHFCDRIVITRGAGSSFLTNLFTMTGNPWRALRYRMSPLFTTGKLRYMFGPMSDCGENLSSALNTNENGQVDIKDINSSFAMDVIGSCAFGIDAGVLRNPISRFGRMGKKMFEVNFNRILAFVLTAFLPQLASKFGVSFIPRDVAAYFRNIIVETIEARKEKKIERNDFVQLFLQLKEKGKVPMPAYDPSDDYLKIEKTDDFQELTITDDLLVGSAFTFIVAGFHTTAATLTYAFHELAFHQDIQDRLRNEIKEQISYHGGITFDALKSMTYLDKVIKETMRLHPAVPVIFRVCTKPYTFPSGLSLSPGEGILISVIGLHNDPKYFPQPDIFNPDRFQSEPKPGSYLPFGEGPRICIAMRFALLEMKFAVAKILNEFSITPNENTPKSLRMEPRAILMVPKGEVSLNVKKL